MSGTLYNHPVRTKLGNLVGGFIAILVGATLISKAAKKVRGSQLPPPKGGGL